jgi:hypothetical protein
MYITYTLYASIPLYIRVSNGFASGLAIFPFPAVILKLFTTIWKAAVPLQYMAFPPSVPGWKELTIEDENGVRRPIVKGIDPKQQQPNFCWTVLGDLILIWLCFQV